MLKPTVTVLSGGFGGARFVDGLKRLEISLTCIVNTADDLTKYGLKISPDLDSVTYSIQDRFDETRGYGLINDSFVCDKLISYIKPQWFHLGDKDFRTHLLRTFKMLRGQSLTQATKSLASQSCGKINVLPMSDSTVRTVISVENCRLSFQEFIVKHRAEPEIKSIELEGCESASPGPDVIKAVKESDLVIVGPSSPIASIMPILSINGIKEALIEREKPTVAVSPVISHKAPFTAAEKHRADLRAKFMGHFGLEHNPAAVAELYSEFIDVFVIDSGDSIFAEAIENCGVVVIQTDLLASSGTNRTLAVKKILNDSLNLNDTAEIV